MSRLLYELGEQRRGARSVLFWSFGLALAAFAGLMVFFILYINAARTNLELSIAEGLPGFGHEVAELIRTELKEGREFQQEIADLGNKAAQLAEQLAAAEVEIASLKKKERENKRLLDLRRAELDTQKKMYEELVSLMDTTPQAADGSAERPADSEDGQDGTEEAAATPLPEARQVIAEVNQLFESAGLRKVRLVEFVALSERGLEKPAITVQEFKGEQTAVLNPGFLSLFTEGDTVRIRSGGGGNFTPLGGPAQPLEEKALDVTVTGIAAERLRHSWLRHLAGLEPVEAGSSWRSNPGEPGHDDLLSSINDLLTVERGRQFRFSAIESVEDKELRKVCFSEYDKKGDLKKTVEAIGCQIKLFTKDRYVEVQFEDGFIVQDKKRIPFYNDQYRLTLPNVDPKVWQEAQLDFIVEK